VVAKNDDGTVQLAIAPGVEVKWAMAALRDPESLPAEYRRPIGGDGPEDSEDGQASARGSE
jgi:preprotein translocase subunit YajC